MTNVRLTRGAGEHYALECEGHATGSPEMCAAISCLAGSLEGWAENSPDVEVQRLEVGPGRVEIAFCPAAWPGSDAACRGVYELLRAGFLRLEAAGPEFLSVKQEEKQEIP